MGINMITVPETEGVRMRWNNESRHERAIGTREDTTTSTASRAGPPAASASMQIDMYAADVPMTRRWPDPILPKRRTCNIVVTPQIATEANTAHAT